VEILIGTPHFYNIKGLKNDIEEKNKKINEENNDQEKYKISLNNLLNDLNKILSENVELLYNDEEDENRKKKKKI
jgi:peptidoglycan hydrolase CwlO-like protein